MIGINNLTTNLVEEKFLKRVAEKVLKGESASWRKEKKDLSIALVGQGRIRELNKKYRGKNRATDVLAFGQNQKSKIKNQKSTEPFLGEIVICLKEVKKNAKRFTPLEITGAGKKDKKKKSLTGFKQTFKEELARVLIHGILHLLGYSHEVSSEKARKMEEKQSHYLSQALKNNSKIKKEQVPRKREQKSK